jgi:O-antigen/teichoic acid export membrane protein
LIFFFFSVIILSILILLIPLLKNHPKIFYLSMSFCLSEALFPLWYFQGIEKMKYITFINVATRIASAGLIFTFVKQSTDYILVPALLGLGTISGAIVGLYIVFRVYNNRFKLLSISKLVKCTRDNIPLFISNISSQIYTNANKLIVGSFLGMQEVAFYDIADKIVNLVKIPGLLVGQTLFPRVSRDKDVRFIKMVMGLVLVFYIIVYSGLFIFANPIIQLFSGTTNAVATGLLRTLALSIIPVCVGLFFNELILVSFGFLKDYAKMRSSSVVVYLAIIGILMIFKQIGLFQMAGAVVFVETFVLGYSYYLCKKNKII